jgi:small subunit ribosomal protein S10
MVNLEAPWVAFFLVTKKKTFMVECIEISLKSFESKLVQNAVLQILAVLPSHWESSQFSFPMTQKKFTVLRSPHIDKKSREQFKIQYYKNIVRLKPCREENDIGISGQKELNVLDRGSLFIENMKRIKFLGVQIKIRIVYATFL